jgi:hypothetical protein
VTLCDYMRKIFIFLDFFKYHLVEFKFESILVGKGINSYFCLRIQILIMHYVYNPLGVPGRIFFQKLLPFSRVPIVQIWKKCHKLKKKSYIATIRDKWLSLVSSHPMRSTYQENYSSVRLTFMPSGRFTKTHIFCNKKWKLIFYEAKPKTLSRRVVCNEKLHTLAKFGHFITLYARVLQSTRSLGWKNQVKSCRIVLFLNIF